MERMNSSPEREIKSNIEEAMGCSQRKGRTRRLKVKLSPEKTEKLKRLLEDYGEKIWNLHAKKFKAPSGIKKRAFTTEDEERLRALQEIFGDDWPLMARLFPGRDQKEVETQWRVLQTRNSIEIAITKKMSKREEDGRDTGCHSREVRIECRSNSYKPGVTANNYEKDMAASTSTSSTSAVPPGRGILNPDPISYAPPGVDPRVNFQRFYRRQQLPVSITLCRSNLL